MRRLKRDHKNEGEHEHERVHENERECECKKDHEHEHERECKNEHENERGHKSEWPLGFCNKGMHAYLSIIIIIGIG